MGMELVLWLCIDCIVYRRVIIVIMILKVVCIIYWDYYIMDSTSFFSCIILFNSHDLIEYIVLFLSILSSSYSLIFQLQKLIIKRSSDFLLVPMFFWYISHLFFLTEAYTHESAFLLILQLFPKKHFKTCVL